jgi:hypothetical protein
VSSLALASDVDVGAVLLHTAGARLGKGSAFRVDQRITDGRLERTMDGASTLTLTLDDHDRALIRSGVFSKQLDLYLAGEWWRLVQVGKQGDTLTLTFEDRAVAYLRQITKPRKAKRSRMTRAEFALSIVREVKAGGGIPFVCPELHGKQPIESSRDKLTKPTREATVSQGLSPGTALTVKGATADANQRANGQRVLDVAASLNAGERATMALMQAVIVESQVQNLNRGDRDSLGILQVRSSTAAGMHIDNRDVEQCCNAFLTRGFWGKGGAIAIAAKNPSMTTGMVAQNTQGSGVPGAYDQWRAEAAKWVAAYGGAGGGGSFETTRLVPYQFQRGGTAGEVEDSWTCLQRLASEVGWRCYIAGGACYFVSEPTLMKAGPRATLSELTLGVDNIDFDVDNGKASNEATVTARIMLLGFPPGSVVELEDCGPADGRWLVRTVERGVFDAAATVTLKRVTKPLPEPAAETTTVSGGGAGLVGLGDSSFAGAGGTTNELADRAYQAASAIDAKRFPYVWGGGHAHAGTPDRGTGRDPGIGFDCTGAVGAVLAAAGMGYDLGQSVPGSGTIAASYGQSGRGQFVTVYACPDMPGQAGHGFLVFHTAQGDRHWGTGHWGKSWDGAGWNPQMHPTGKFSARHWPGT